MEKAYKIGKHQEIVIALDSETWTKLTGDKPVKIKFDKEGFTLDWGSE